MKRKLLFAIVALMCSIGTWAQPTASTPAVGGTYYLYNPLTKLFMTTNVDLPFIRPTGKAWKLEAADGHDGWITLRLVDNTTDGEGYFWGKWWANNPNQNSASYADERVFKNGHWIFEQADPKFSTIHYVAGNHFYSIGKAYDTKISI